MPAQPAFSVLSTSPSPLRPLRRLRPLRLSAYLRSDLSRPPSSQLPAVPRRPVRLALRYLDAESWRRAGWCCSSPTRPSRSGWSRTLGSLPILLFTLYGGVLADRVNKHRLVLVLQCLMLCEALALGDPHRAPPGHGALGHGAGRVLRPPLAFEVPTRQAFIARDRGASRPDERDRARLQRLQRGAGGRPGHRRRAHRDGGDGGLLLRQRGELSRGDRRPAPDAGRRRGRAGPCPEAAFRERSARGSATSSVTAGRARLILIADVQRVRLFVPHHDAGVRARRAAPSAGGYGALVSAVGVGAAVGALSIAAFGSRVRQGRMVIGGAGAVRRGTGRERAGAQVRAGAAAVHCLRIHDGALRHHGQHACSSGRRPTICAGA